MIDSSASESSISNLVDGFQCFRKSGEAVLLNQLSQQDFKFINQVLELSASTKCL